MRLTNLLGGTALAMTAAAAAGAISAQELPACEGCADSMTIVSWGGAYSNSQNKAYHEPYQALTGIEIVNDESSAEAVAKLRAMEEAGNMTWDLVDVTGADSIRLCDEGLAMEIDVDAALAEGEEGATAKDQRK